MQVQIRIKEQLDPSWQDWFAPLQLRHEAAGTTVLTGVLPDQAALQGMLLAISRLSLTLLALDTSESRHDHSPPARKMSR